MPRCKTRDTDTFPGPEVKVVEAQCGVPSFKDGVTGHAVLLTASPPNNNGREAGAH